MSLLIRPMRRDETGPVLAMVRDLADYEGMLHKVTATEADLDEALFCAAPRVFCEIAELDGSPVGHALWFYNFSTFHGRHGIFLEELFVSPARRGAGIGRALLAHLARRCAAEKLTRLDWGVFDFNEPAIGFYRSIGARLMDDWTLCRLEGESLARMAEAA